MESGLIAKLTAARENPQPSKRLAQRFERARKDGDTWTQYEAIRDMVASGRFSQAKASLNALGPSDYTSAAAVSWFFTRPENWPHADEALAQHCLEIVLASPGDQYGNRARALAWLGAYFLLAGYSKGAAAAWREAGKAPDTEEAIGEAAVQMVIADNRLESQARRLLGRMMSSRPKSTAVRRLQQAIDWGWA